VNSVSSYHFYQPVAVVQSLSMLLDETFSSLFLMLSTTDYEIPFFIVSSFSPSLLLHRKSRSIIPFTIAGKALANA
jgi:hypothetical protein